MRPVAPRRQRVLGGLGWWCFAISLAWACGGAGDAAPPLSSAELAPLPPLLGPDERVIPRNPTDCRDPPPIDRASPDAGPLLAYPFPDRIEPRYARGFTVVYDGPVKRVTVRPGGRAPAFRYLLIHCNAPVPDDVGDATVVRIPVQRAITLSTTELPAFEMLGVVDALIAHSTFDYVSSPAIRRRIDAGDLFEVGVASGLDVERVIQAAPGVVFSDTVADPALDAGGRLGTLREAGIPVVAVPSYLETTPLGRAEWLAFVALFFNREAEAKAILGSLASRYQALAALGRAASPRPMAITGGPMGGTWHVPGGRSHMATLLADAGFDYPWQDDPYVGSLNLAFEAVWRTAREARWWIHPSGWRSRPDIEAADARLTSLPAFRSGRVAIHDRRLGPGGGNDFWESGNARPDLVLADLLALAHPDLLPDHTLVFHRRLGRAGDEP